MLFRGSQHPNGSTPPPVRRQMRSLATLHRAYRTLLAQAPPHAPPAPLNRHLHQRTAAAMAEERETKRARTEGVPAVSGRIAGTDEPCIVQMQRMLRGAQETLSLAQGVVYWQPPAEALQAAQEALAEPSTSQYCPDDGLPELRAALVSKLARDNGFTQSDVMVTAGANQAFMNVVTALCDARDEVVLFVPYYFNHLMACQMTNCQPVLAPCDAEIVPDMAWLAKHIAGKKMVVMVNPGNPSGSVIPRHVLQEASRLCAAHRAWLVLDNTYEYFLFDGAAHSCLEAPHIINIFSFSKAFGMMGWRCGYLAYHRDRESVASELLKVQDTIPICPPVISQRVALGALKAGRAWVVEQLGELQKNREAIEAAVAPLGKGALVGKREGAIYMLLKLPKGCQDDKAVVEWLARKHGVCVIPGSACGLPGHVRVAFGNLEPGAYQTACKRLRLGLEALVKSGMS